MQTFYALKDLGLNHVSILLEKFKEVYMIDEMTQNALKIVICLEYIMKWKKENLNSSKLLISQDSMSKKFINLIKSWSYFRNMTWMHL